MVFSRTAGFGLAVSLLAAGLLLPTRARGQEAAAPTWTSLFDGKSLDGWSQTDYAGVPEDARVEDGTLILDMGPSGMSGVTRTAFKPRQGYEIGLEAMRVSGSDFFCGLTFPVGDDHCSLVVGGWGGSLVGLSSLDGLDASQNETTSFMQFENSIWYPIRVRVTPGRIQAWISDKRIVDVQTAERRISVRSEMDGSKPLGLSTWHTKAALRQIRFRELSAAEIKADAVD